jgi:hypothetical protein
MSKQPSPAPPTGAPNPFFEGLFKTVQQYPGVAVIVIASNTVLTPGPESGSWSVVERPSVTPGPLSGSWDTLPDRPGTTPK